MTVRRQSKREAQNLTPQVTAPVSEPEIDRKGAGDGGDVSEVVVAAPVEAPVEEPVKKPTAKVVKKKKKKSKKTSI